MSAIEFWIFLVFVALWTFSAPFLTLMGSEIFSELKYAPLSMFFYIAFLSGCFATPVLCLFIKELKKTRENISPFWVWSVMLAPIVFAFFVHSSNVAFAHPEKVTMDLEIVNKRVQLRTPRGNPTFRVYRLFLNFKEQAFFARKLNGDHTVFVHKDVYDTYKIGEYFQVTMQEGFWGAPYILDGENIVSLGR